jgi:predicted acylesterase/phospholipase RssA
MLTKHEALTPFAMNLVCGAGGSRAILGSSGAILACHFAGISDWRTVGGASGGSIPTVLLAAGYSPKDIAHYCLDIDYSALLTRHGGILKVVSAYFFKDTFYRLARPKHGLFGSEKVGEFIDALVPEWPDNFWTVAVSGSSQLLFTKDGVTEYRLDGSRCKISDKPAPVGLAIRATSAIPGVIDAVKFNNCYLFDGALSVDGRTPIGLAKRHYGAVPERVVAVDVGENPESQTFLGRVFFNMFWRFICGRHCPAEGEYPVRSEGTVLVKPNPEIRALQFQLRADDKCSALMSGFSAGVIALEKAGVLTDSRLEEAKAIVNAFTEIKRTSLTPEEVVARTEKLLASQGLY